MNKAQLQVKEFHQIFRHPAPEVPIHISTKLAEKRVGFIDEEISEYLQAVEACDLAAVADALGDILYFVYGTAVCHGIDMEPVFDEIHRANMTKLWEDGLPRFRNSDQKVIKPPTWQEPDIAAVMQKQMDDTKHLRATTSFNEYTQSQQEADS